jgi:hypothetical protein
MRSSFAASSVAGGEKGFGPHQGQTDGENAPSDYGKDRNMAYENQKQRHDQRTRKHKPLLAQQDMQ